MLFFFRCPKFKEQRVGSLLGISYKCVEASFLLFSFPRYYFHSLVKEESSFIFATFECEHCGGCFNNSGVFMFPPQSYSKAKPVSEISKANNTK